MTSSPSVDQANDELVDQFCTLFAGNPRAVGTQTGGVRRAPDDRVPTADWFRAMMERHLDGTFPIGVYPINRYAIVNDKRYHGLECVKWGCVDWDQGYEESWPDAANVHNMLTHLGISSWIERSRSKGWHLWVFAEDWTPAATMRHALMAACEMVDAPTKEVNPKQITLEDGQLGNYVRLPYPGGSARPDLDFWDSDNLVSQSILQGHLSNGPDTVSESPDLFAMLALEQRTPTSVLENLAKRYTPPPDTDVDVPSLPSTALSTELTRKLDGLTWTLFEHGPLPDKVTHKIDRSGGLWRLASMLAEGGYLTPDEAWSIMCDADRRWGKFLDNDQADVLQRTLQKAWGRYA